MQLALEPVEVLAIQTLHVPAREVHYAHLHYSPQYQQYATR